MSETTFENAKVGDRVYSPLLKGVVGRDKTNATISAVGDEYKRIAVTPDIILTGNPGAISFFASGIYCKGGGQILFWENPIKEIPVRPKRFEHEE